MSDTYRLKLVQPAAMQCNFIPYFPGDVVEGHAIDITLSGSAFTVSWNAAEAGFSAFGLLLGAAVDSAAAMRMLTLAPRVITESGAVTVAASDGPIILNKSAASATSIQLPTVASRNRLPVTISDFAGNGGDITITPASGERIHGLAANAPWTVGSGGAGLGGVITLYPVTGVGWTK